MTLGVLARYSRTNWNSRYQVVAIEVVCSKYEDAVIGIECGRYAV